MKLISNEYRTLSTYYPLDMNQVISTRQQWSAVFKVKATKINENTCLPFEIFTLSNGWFTLIGGLATS